MHIGSYNDEPKTIQRMNEFVQESGYSIDLTDKKKKDFSKVEFFSYNEGLCVQCMHIGIYNDEPKTIQRMNEFAQNNGYNIELTEKRYHHEIYLSDPRKADINKLKTVIRQPVK